MKLLRQISLLFVLGLAFILTAGAAYRNVSYLPDMEEYEEIKAVLPEMIPEVNEILKEEGYDKTIAAEDISLAEAYPIYLDENYFSPEIDTPEDLLSLIEKQEHYVWKLPVNMGNQTLLLGLGKGYPVRSGTASYVTGETLSELEENVGKWHLTTVEFVPESELYPQKVRNAGMKAEQVIFVNGLKGSNVQMAICIDNGNLGDVLSLTNAEINDQGNDTLSFGESVHYTYHELQESLGMLSDQMGGGNGVIRAKNWAAVLRAAAIAALLFAFAAVWRKYNVNKKITTK